MLTAIMIDTHTHSVLSGHAWSTLRENAVAAAARGMAGMCLTEHAHAMPGAGPFFLTAAQNMLPATLAGIRVFYGVEANIIDLQGKVDVDDKSLFDSEFTIASMHDLCVQPGTVAENTDAYLGALNHPCVDILGHIDDRKTASDFAVVAREAGRLGKLIEINNNSMLIRKGSRERVETLARVCAENGTRVAVASDAHLDDMVGSVAPALEMLGRIGFPEELIVNRSLESFLGYMEERTARLDAVRKTFARQTGVSLRRKVRRLV
ncbi:MAG: PHP domain-containing protein [Planctomycetes bacterium]|nr:PHP domain-containing protein [Planctomycetota bacterium]